MNKVWQMRGHYNYTLTSKQQSAIQMYLRFLPEEHRTPEWELLHELTYTGDWRKEEAEAEAPAAA